MSVAFSPDGQTLASGSSDGTIRLWDVSVTSWKDRTCRKVNRNLTAGEWRRYLGSARLYEKTCAHPPLHESIFEKGDTLAQTGNITEAIVQYQEVIPPSYGVDFEARANQVYVEAMVGEGEELARAGEVVSATLVFSEALRLDPTLDLDPRARANQVYAETVVEEGES